MLRRQHHQPRVEIVGHVGARAWQRMDAPKVAGVAQVGTQPLLQCLRHLVGVALELFGAVLGELGHRRLGGIPEARAILIQIRRRRRQPAQGIAEHGGRFARHDAAQFHPPVLQPAMRGRRGGGGAEIDGSRHPSRRMQLAQVGLVRVDLERQRAGTVDILLDDGRPVIGEIARQFGLHARVVDGDGRRQDQRIAVALLPQAMDHRRHESQHTPGALEFHQRRPVGIQPVEDFRVDWIRRLHAFLVITPLALGRELRRLGVVKVREGPRRYIALLERLRPGQRLEQPPSHDLEALFGRRRSP